MCVIICNHNGHNGDIDTDHDKIIDLGNFDDARDGDNTPNLIEPFKNKLNHSKLGFEYLSIGFDSFTWLYWYNV